MVSFLDKYLAGSPESDFNRDGASSSTDLYSFLDCYLAHDANGCTNVTSREPVCTDGRALSALVIQYTGEDCTGTANSQSLDSYKCSGSPAFAPVVLVVAADRPLAQPGAVIWFVGSVSLGGTFEVAASANASAQLGSHTTFVLYNADQSAIVHSTDFETGCGQPLNLGDRFGSLRIVGYRAVPMNAVDNASTTEGSARGR